MSSRDNSSTYTTNEEDQREVSKLQNRLQNYNAAAGAQSIGHRIPSVEIAEGVHKYVLIKAALDGEEQYIVTSRKNASYHRNAAEPMIEKLEQAGYSDIEVTGGGRINLDTPSKTMSIYGYSYGFGLANHAISRQVVKEDPRYHDFAVDISDEGY